MLLGMLVLLGPAAASAAAEEPPEIKEPTHQATTVGKAIKPLIVTGARMAKLKAENLPAGLMLKEVSETEGEITGEPTTPGSVVVTLRATNKEAAETSKTFEWTVEPPPTITKPPDQDKTVGATISLPVSGTLMSTLTAEHLPAGLTLEKVSENEWKIVGKTTTPETTTVKLEAKNASGEGSVSTEFKWTVEAAPTITKPPDQDKTVGATISLPVSGTLMSTLTAEHLPAGLTLEKVSENEWKIVGKTTTPETTTVKLEAKNASGEGSVSTEFKWTVEAAPTITKPPDQLTAVGATVSLPVSGTLMSTLTAEHLPAGLTLEKVSESEWKVVGKATIGEVTTVKLEAKNAAGEAASTEFKWTVEAAVTIGNPGPQTSTVGVPVVLHGTGGEMTSLTATGLPAGLKAEMLSATEWDVTGTPTTAQPATTVTVEVEDAAREVARIQFSWAVGAAPPAYSGTLTISPSVVFSAARASCGGVTWSPATVVTQWMLDGAPIAGATSATYVPPRAEDGRQLACRETATAAGVSSTATSAGRTIHEQPPQPAWPIGPSSAHCSSALCMQEGAAPSAVVESYPVGGSWWGAQQVRCVSAPWTSMVGDSPSPAVRAFAEAGTVTMTLQRMTGSGAVTLASQQLTGLGGARDLLDGAGATPFPGAIVGAFGAQAFLAGEAWSLRFPGAVGRPTGSHRAAG